MADCEASEHSPLERISILLDLIEKGVHEITESVGRVNEKLLPNTKLTSSRKGPMEEQEKLAQPSGWLEKNIRHLERIRSLLGKANQEATLLKNSILENVPVKSTAGMQ